MKLPSYEGDDVAKAQARFAELNTQADALAAASAARAVEIQAELASIEQEKARISTVTVDEELAAVCHLDAIITMVDAAHIDQQLSRLDLTKRLHLAQYLEYGHRARLVL